MTSTNLNQNLLQRRTKLIGKHSPLFYDEPLQLVKGEDVWVFDQNGKRYLDVYNNVPHVGHCHPHVVKALTDQASTLNTHTRYLHENIVKYAERLTATFDDSLDMAMFTCTGSEANELALRIARYSTGGTGIIVSDFAYHGNTEAVAELGTAFMAEAKATRRVRSIPIPDSYRGIEGVPADQLADAYAEEVRKTIAAFEADGIKVAGILVCPDFANEGLLNVPHGFMEKAVALVREAGGLFIADEVQAGFGRSGKHMWAHQMYDVVPDIVTMGKPMGNGHPLAGIVSRSDLIDPFAEASMYFNTFGGNPVSCAVGMAVLDVLEQEHLLENAITTGQYLSDQLRKLQDKYSLIGEVRSLGMFFGVELVSDRDSKTPAPDAARKIINLMKQKGVLISTIGKHNCILKLRPPMPFQPEHADILISTLDEVFATVNQEYSA
ncbi:MAG: aminotransferase class III-fold pyridoxal phosphate-dependent enzyme [Oceanospirillaceae bacterium]|nr:aminotransferase class III-fold pyridoxal phosphate-dependent enzyme [Oceanospirillaceae bacterium]